MRQRGWEVDVFERVESELSGRGAGIVAQPELLERLRGLGLATDDLGVEMTTRKILDQSGRLTHDACMPADPDRLGAGLPRPARCVLRPGATTRRATWLKRFEQDERAVTAYFSDGSRRAADLLVGADGIRSSVRRNAIPSWRRSTPAMSPGAPLFAEDAFAPAIHRELFDYMTFCLPPGEQFLGYPVAGPDNDLPVARTTRYNVVWYRPATSTTNCRVF